MSSKGAMSYECWKNRDHRAYKKSSAHRTDIGFGKSVCKYCGADIYWTKKDDRWVPVDIKGERHQCGVDA